MTRCRHLDRRGDMGDASRATVEGRAVRSSSSSCRGGEHVRHPSRNRESRREERPSQRARQSNGETSPGAARAAGPSWTSEVEHDPEAKKFWTTLAVCDDAQALDGAVRESAVIRLAIPHQAVGAVGDRAQNAGPFAGGLADEELRIPLLNQTVIRGHVRPRVREPRQGGGSPFGRERAAQGGDTAVAAFRRPLAASVRLIGAVTWHAVDHSTSCQKCALWPI